MRSITTLDLQYAHRFYGFKGEAQYLHGHTGVLTIEVEDLSLIHICWENIDAFFAAVNEFYAGTAAGRG